MSDIRLVMAGSAIIFAGFVIGGITVSQYSQYMIQATQFGDCYDYSTGSTIPVKCDTKFQEEYLYLGLSLGIIGIGAFVIIKGIKGRWDQDVKPSEMLGPKYD